MSEFFKYFDNNMGGMIILFEVMCDFKVKYIVFFLMVVIYGVLEYMLIKEIDL